MRRSAWWSVPFLCLVLGGCGGVPPVLDVKADRATYDAIAADYLRYVDADAALLPEQKMLRHDTVATWDLRLRKREEALAAQPATGATGVAR